ncbi:ABC transporter permease [Streptomyces cinnabarinus]|uniref:Transport permease protein n=1 Tax=Streptomyces cinnabarinus TaxID=67287 RepID=A0ABY7KJR8_9ACTN|nr:ABC transporter permease [Streptomyces cinnabarinus]WAZ24779.1 ABC transporter permease [Streptomyces cinnabarinus]
MSAPLPPSAWHTSEEPPLSRLRWAAGDAATVARRYLIHLRGAPERAAMALVIPLLFTLLFVYVLGSNMRPPGGVSYVDFVVPGMLAQMAVFGIAASAAVVAEDKERGVTDRFHALPMSRTGVPVGQSLAECLGGVITLVVMAVCGLLVGWRPTAMAAGLALLLLARYAFSWLGMWIGLVLPSRSATDLVGMLMFPLTMISNIFVPTEGLPTGLRLLADWNPVSAVVSAVRELFGNPVAVPADAAWPIAHPVAATLGWSALLLAVFGPLTVAKYRAPRH